MRINNRALRDTERTELRLETRYAIERRHKCEYCAAIYTCERCSEEFAAHGSVSLQGGSRHSYICDKHHNYRRYFKGCWCAVCAEDHRRYKRGVDGRRRARKKETAAA